MRLQDFEYELPQELIAQYPLKSRDQARMMVIDRARGKIFHDVFSQIEKYLPVSSTIVLNDSKVVPARLLGRRETGGKTEVFLLKPLSDGYSYETLIRPLKRLNIDEKIIFNGSRVYAQLKDPHKKIVRFNRKNISGYLNKIGHMPLPPYIKRSDEALDREYYQTVYARHAGSVASPTAGLHFTKPLLAKLKKDGHAIVKVTLHVNFATFNLVKEEDVTHHKMHSESYAASQNMVAAIKKTKAQGKKVLAVGTTSCRTLETLAQTKKRKGMTDIFIYPGYKFQMTDLLLTNFHLPESTLLMLAYAFGGVDLMKRAYREAIKEKYRFYSYGDCMLII